MRALENGVPAAGYFCEYRSRLLDANKQVNSLKLTVEELSIENSRLKDAAATIDPPSGLSRIVKTSKPVVTVVPYPPTLVCSAFENDL